MSNPRLYKSSRSTQVTQLCVCAVNHSCAEGGPICLLATRALSRADAAGGDWAATLPFLAGFEQGLILLVQNRVGCFWFFFCLFLNMHSSYLSICYETLRIRSLRNLWQDNSDNFWMLQIFWHLSLQLLSWICNRNYIFPLLSSYLLHFPGWVFPAPETPVSFINTHSDVLLTALFLIFSVLFDPLGSLWGSQGGGLSKE